MSVTKWLLLFIASIFINIPVCMAENTEAAVPQASSPAGSAISFPAINPLAPPATRSPQDTLFEFLDKSRHAIDIIYNIEAQAMQEGGLFHTPAHIAQGEYAEELLEQAIRTLNLSDIPEAHRARIGLERALMLKEILERIPLPEKESIPDQHATIDGENKLERWEIPGTEIAITRGSKDQYVDEYLFSPETVHRIPEFFEQIRQLPPINRAMQHQYNFYDYYTSTPGRMLPPKWSLWLPKDCRRHRHLLRRAIAGRTDCPVTRRFRRLGSGYRYQCAGIFQECGRRPDPVPRPPGAHR